MVATLMFQSTHPRRVWLPLIFHISYSLLVSIHTPTKGVTYEHVGIDRTLLFQSTHPRRVWQRSTESTVETVESFNPHTHEGCDANLTKHLQYQRVSIHTPTKGVTQYGDESAAAISTFQSTHPRRVWLHIQQIAEYHDAKIIILRKMAK